MEVQKFQIDENPEGRPLKFVVKKYKFTAFPEHEAGTVLLCLHGIGFTKETWEPFLEEIAAADSKEGRKATIKEAWTLDVPNHGESSHLNDQLLFEDPRDVSLQEYARCGQRLLRAGLMKHSDKDRLIVVGHSVGCGAAIWLSSLYHKEDNKVFDGILLIEPPRELFWEPGYGVMTSAFLVEPTKVRRDIWESREAAKAWMVKRAPWKIWDPRVLDTYVKYGLRDLPTVWYPDQKGVTLSAARHHEVFAYNNHVELNVPTSCTPEVCKIMPMHVFVAKRSPLSPDEKEFGWMTEKGITFSILPPKSDHLVIHQLPKEVARDTLAVLDKIPQKVQGRARL